VAGLDVFTGRHLFYQDSKLVEQHGLDCRMPAEHGVGSLVEQDQGVRIATFEDVAAVVVEAEDGLERKQAAMGAKKTAVFATVGSKLHGNAQEEVEQDLDDFGIAGHGGTAAAAAGTDGTAAAQLAEPHGVHVVAQQLGLVPHLGQGLCQAGNLRQPVLEFGMEPVGSSQFFSRFAAVEEVEQVVVVLGHGNSLYFDMLSFRHPGAGRGLEFFAREAVFTGFRPPPE
jgi:hypothetical protein